MQIQVDNAVPDDPIVTPKLLDERTSESSDSCPEPEDDTLVK